MSMHVDKKNQSDAKISSIRLTSGSGNELLPFIQQGENLLISAQLLHKKLKSGYQFSDWIKRRISDYGFENGVDYFSEKSEKLGKGRKLVDFLLTIDTAKELAMLEKNEIGRQIRRYFIQKEKEARGISLLPYQKSVFRDVDRRSVNDRTLLHYCQVLDLCHMRGDGGRSMRYWMHYVKMDGVMWVSEEMANHIYHSRMVYNDRKAMKASMPVLPLGWDEREGGVL